MQFPTSTEPTLGTWTVEAVAAESSAGAATSSSSVAAFTLDRYVLPTFEVKVAPDSPAVYKGQTSPVTGLVTAAYTYGEPLAGGSTFTLNVWQRSGGGGGGGVGFVGDIAMSRPAAGNAAVSPTQTQQRVRSVHPGRVEREDQLRVRLRRRARVGTGGAGHGRRDGCHAERHRGGGAVQLLNRVVPS